MEYKIKITEKLQKVVTVNSSDAKEAMDFVKKRIKEEV